MTKPRRDDAWVSRADLLRIFDCSATGFDKYIRPHAAPEHVRRDGKSTFYYCRGLLERWAIRHRAGVSDDALLTSTADSPALERYREERAALAKLDRLEREREVVRLADLVANLTLLGTILRNATETLAREFGPAAAEILDGALDDYEKQVQTLAQGRQEGETR